MFKLNLVIAIRNLMKSSFYSLINLFGLTVGITACLVILVFVKSELSYDRFNVNADRIFRMDWELVFGENSAYNAAVTPPMAGAMVRDYPEVEAAARLNYSGSFQFRLKDTSAPEWRVVYADNDLFKIFTIPFLEGNPANALLEPNSMVICKTTAEQFFPGEDALGKLIVVDNATTYKVTGIFQDLPETSHFHYRIFLSMEGLDESKNGNWIGGPYNTYLLLREGTDAAALEAKLPGMVEKYLLPQVGSVMGSTFMDDFRSGGNQLLLHLRPLLDIHLHSHLRNELEPNGDINVVYLLGSIAFLILIIACINFMNLATARSSKRALEVGIRKTLGSSRGTLAVQFLAESTILTLLSFALAMGITIVVLPAFNILAGLHLQLPVERAGLALSLLAVAILVGFLAGSYPAVVLSSFRPASVLKGKLTVGRRSLSLRSGLVVFQFFISIFLIITTLALNQQMHFVRTMELGFNKNQILLVRDVENAGELLPSIRDEILRYPFIVDGTISSYFPGPGSARNTPLLWKFGSEPNPGNSVNAEKWMVDYDYVPTLGLQITAGRNFSRDFPSDSSAVILNETAVGRFGFDGDGIGQRISLFRNNPDGSQDRTKLESWTVVGVVKDFNFESLRYGVTPLGLFFGTSSHGFLAFRYESSDPQGVIASVEKTWKTMAPGEPFNYSFLDEDFQRFYSTDQKLGRLFAAFSGLAIIIACLGLFALTAFSAEQRTKEIGIRKVMGATAKSIVLLLSAQFAKLVLYGFVIAAPLAWYGMSWYLRSYTYKTNISAWIYFGALMVAVLLASVTIGYQSLKAAHSNPVDALKTE